MSQEVDFRDRDYGMCRSESVICNFKEELMLRDTDSDTAKLNPE